MIASEVVNEEAEFTAPDATDTETGGEVSELSASTGKEATITVTWGKYSLTASITVTAGPLPTTLDIANREEILAAILAGESIKMELTDNIGTTSTEFDDYVATGEITVVSSDTSVVTCDGLTLSVVF